jgi:imidazolonepropionase-like amidohydrolase
MPCVRSRLIPRFAQLPILVGTIVAAGCGEPRAGSFVTVNAAITAIVHVRVIDGTGTPAKDDQTAVIQDGLIRAVGDSAAMKTPAGAHILDGRGRTLIPGLVGMHEHLFYQADGIGVPTQAAFARLYLASGVTTIRTAGTLDFKGDLRIKQRIDGGELPGPKVHVTGPYLNARTAEPDPEGIAREVDSQADRGATSFKAYTSLRAPELKAAIDAAHARGLRLTGHLCAVGFREAAAMGIDNLEHGLAVDSEFYWDKQPGVCPNQGATVDQMTRVDILTDAGIHRTIADLVRHGVAVTSTLAIFESFTGDESAFDPRMPDVLSSWVRKLYDGKRREWIDRDTPRARMWGIMRTKEMQFERAFVAAGGQLLAGVDPTGWGGIVAGFGDQRELELLVEAGLTPEAAIRVATSNGADFLYESDHIGTIAVAKQADLVLVRGNPAANISDVRNVDVVFKDGIGYDPAALIAATQGAVGRDDVRRFLRWPLNIIPIALIVILVERVLLRRFRAKRVPAQRREVEPGQLQA